MTTLRVLPAADRDTDEAADYYATTASLDVALRFLAAVSACYEFLLENPLVGSTVSAFDARLSELRFWRVKGFEDYLVFYRALPEHLEVVRVLHGARDLPGLF